MSESIASRVGRIISGSVNAVVTAVENVAPEIVLEEAIREVDSAIDQVRQELGKVSVAKHLANKRLAEENGKHETLAEQIATAIEQAREDLAEAGIAKQLDIEAQIPVLEAAITDAVSKEKELEGYIQALQAKKREMNEELKSFLELKQQTAATPVGEAGSASSSLSAKVAKAESAFDRIIEKQTGLAGRAGSTDTESAAKLAELEELSRQNRIKERLAAFKADSSSEG
jgi:phage shock protein A